VPLDSLSFSDLSFSLRLPIVSFGNDLFQLIEALAGHTS